MFCVHPQPQNKRKLLLETEEHNRGLNNGFAGQVLAVKYRGPAVNSDMQMDVGRLWCKWKGLSNIESFFLEKDCAKKKRLMAQNCKGPF